MTTSKIDRVSAAKSATESRGETPPRAEPHPARRLPAEGALGRLVGSTGSGAGRPALPAADPFNCEAAYRPLTATPR
jgi:hypothetical protein